MLNWQSYPLAYGWLSLHTSIKMVSSCIVDRQLTTLATQSSNADHVCPKLCNGVHLPPWQLNGVRYDWFGKPPSHLDTCIGFALLCRFTAFCMFIIITEMKDLGLKLFAINTNTFWEFGRLDLTRVLMVHSFSSCSWSNSKSKALLAFKTF